jgi:hypothetical protein|tara:strand:- start:71 stop:445 length:375 start_codon:yes stop_codon:yes gene_type:complete
MTTSADAPTTILYDDLMDLPKNSRDAYGHDFLVQLDGTQGRSYGRVLSTYADGSGFARSERTKVLFRFVPVSGKVRGGAVRVHVFFGEDTGDQAGTLEFSEKTKIRASVSWKLQGRAARADALR